MNPHEVLQKNNLKRTSCREGIIAVVMSSVSALSENEIREQLQGNYDRTTFYRSFKTLEESKIIHKIVVDNQLVKYAIDHTISSKQSHAHFYCQQCNAVTCLDAVPIDIPKLPAGYSCVETEMIIKGKCKQCKSNKPKG